MSRSATPLRAIPSNLSGKSAPSLPPASQTYEPLVKATLRQRLSSKIFLLSAVFCWFQTSFLSIWSSGGAQELGFGGILTLPFLPLTIFTSLANWVLIAVPVIVIRKRYLTSSRTKAGSPAKTWQEARTKSSSRNVLMVLCTSSICAIAVAVFSAYQGDVNARGDPKLTIFVKSKKHPSYLNGRLIFLVITQLVMAVGFHLRDTMLDRYVFRWNSSKSKFGAIDVFQTIIFSSILTSTFMPFAMLVFATLRLALPILYKVPILPMLLRPFTAHFLRGSWTFLLPFLHLKLLLRAWFLGLTTILTWEFSETLFDSFIPQPIQVSHLTADPITTLVSGISSTDRIFKFFALSELQAFASDTSATSIARRTEFFSNQKFSPTLWSQLCREILLILGQDYQALLRRGAPPPPAPVKAPEPVKPAVDILATPAKLIEKPIYRNSAKSPLKSVVDSLAADGSFPKVVEAGAEAIHLPEALKSVEDALVKPGLEKGKGEVKKGIVGVKGVFGNIMRLVSGAIRGYAPTWAGEALSKSKEWWLTERPSKVAEGCVPYRELDAVAIDVLSHLVCASLEEDRYGVVQRDVPKILEAFLSFLTAIEEYQRELNSRLPQPKPTEELTPEEVLLRETLQGEIDKAGESLGIICNELKEGVGRIVQTFGDKLQAFKFPPHIARKLQGFLDYC